MREERHLEEKIPLIYVQADYSLETGEEVRLIKIEEAKVDKECTKEHMDKH